MSSKTIDAIGRNILASSLAAEEMTVVWHAGEPMVLPVTWYEDAFVRLDAAAPDRLIHHCFQTNGVCIDDDWIDFWARWNVRVGVSLDGPQRLHDLNRRTRRGKGSFALTMRGIERLQRKGYPFHVITVLTRESLAEPDLMFDFYLSQCIREVSFNIEEEEGAHRQSSLSGLGVDDAYRSFLHRILERLQSEPNGFGCREADGVRWLIEAPAHARRENPQVKPLAILSVAADGSMSTFSPEFLGIEDPAFDNFAFGNVNEEGPEAILRHLAFQRLYADIEVGVSACRASCPYFDVCGGGAPANKYFELGSCRGTETLYCRLTKKATIQAVLQAWEAKSVDA